MRFATIAISISDGRETGELISIRMWPAPLEGAERLAAALTEASGPPLEGLSSMPSDEYASRTLQELGTVIISPGGERP